MSGISRSSLRRLVIVLTLTVATSLGLRGIAPAAQSAHAQQVDAAVLHQAQIDAINAGDVAGALAFVGDRSVFVGGGSCFPTACLGKPAVQKEFELEVASHLHLTRTSYQVSGNVVTGTFEVTSDPTNAAGIQRALGHFIVIAANGQILLTVAQLDPTDAQTAAFLAFLAGAPR